MQEVAPKYARQAGIKLREFRGGNADYREQGLAYQKLLACNEAIATECALPKTVADDNSGRCGLRVVARTKEVA